MNEQKFEELLLKNNEYLIKQMDKKIDKALISNNEKLSIELTQKLTQSLTQKLTKEIMDKVKIELKKSEERQNSKLAYLEFTYGEKISAIFDKIRSMEEIMIRNEKENQKYRRIVDHHSDILYSQDLRITNLEKKVGSN